MSNLPPVVYLLHGDDEFGIAQFIAEIESRLGDPGTASMNTTQLDGQSFNPEDLLSAASTMPFLAPRRLVILTNPLSRLTTPALRDRFIEQLDKIPQTTALLLVVNHLLTEERDRRKGKIHWLEDWAQTAGSRVYLRAFSAPKGGLLVRWIQERAKHYEGQIALNAAEKLAELVGGDSRQADQELQKLLAYVNYERQIELEDVQHLTADAGEGDIFQMVDALGNQNAKTAVAMLHRLLDQQDPFSIFGMVVRQFRLLLLTREILDLGGHKAKVVQDLKVPGFVADKLVNQARQFTLPLMEEVYHRLLNLDEAIKTGQMSCELALDTFVVAFTAG